MYMCIFRTIRASSGEYRLHKENIDFYYDYTSLYSPGDALIVQKKIMYI